MINFLEGLKDLTDDLPADMVSSVKEYLGDAYAKYDEAEKNFKDFDTNLSDLNFQKFQSETKQFEEDEANFKKDM